MPQEGRAAGRLVVGIAGHIGAGKTSVGKYLESAHGFSYLRYSQVLAEWISGGAAPKDQLQAIGWDVMKDRQHELNQRLIAKVGPQGDYVVDGLRHPLDYDSLKGAFAPRFHLLFVESPPELRWQRLRTATRFREFNEFQAADAHPVEQNILLLKPKARIVICNDGTLPALYGQVERVLGELSTGERQ